VPVWKCNVCGFEIDTSEAPDPCPSCGSSSLEFYVKGHHPKDKLEVGADLLIINGSKHRAHNTAYFASLAEDAAKQKGVSCKVLHLADYKVEHCWCCYSMREEKCEYPCRNGFDDVHRLHRLIMGAKAIIIVTPINWNNMPAQLKDFLDRMTCIENMYLINHTTPLAGRTVGLIVNGHEDGAYKTAFDIFMVFQNLGFVLAPFGIAYSTHGRANKPETDNDYFRGDELMKTYVRNVTHNVIELAKLEIEKKMEIRPSCE
jgi:multimeric flavodoxin WrbA